MRAVLWMALVGIGAGAACARPELPVASARRLPQTVRVRTAGRVLTVPLEDYVLGSALAEVSPVGESAAAVSRIFEVQAILARTYAVFELGRHGAEGFDLCDTTHCQLYDPARIGTSRFTQAARDAVARTAGEVLLYGGRPAETLFHSDCGGHTADAGDVWGGAPVPYLLGGPDDVPALTHRRWQVDVSTDSLRRALNLDPRSEPGRRLDTLDVVTRDASGRAERLEVHGEHMHVVRGEDLRAILNRTLGDRGIQSTRFSVARSGGSYRFQGTGFGHGVGLCQVGAAARARQGQTASAILAAYFPGTQLVRE